MKSILVALLASTSIQALACIPAVTKDVLLKVAQPGRKVLTLTYGGNEFLYSEVLMRLPLEIDEEVKSLKYDKDILTEDVVMSTEVPVSAHFKVETIQLRKVDGLYSGETEVVITVFNKQTKTNRLVKQKVEVETLPSPRGC